MEDRLSEDMFDGEDLSTPRHLDICREKPEVLTQQSLASVSGGVSARLGCGGAGLTVQSACTSATQAIGEAFERIRRGRVDLAVHRRRGQHDVHVLRRRLRPASAPSPATPDPRTASRPFDARRDGFRPSARERASWSSKSWSTRGAGRRTSTPR